MNRTRRDMIWLAAAGIAAEVLALPAVASDHSQVWLAGPIRRLFADHRAAAAIGRAYLRSEAAPRSDLTTLVADVAQIARADGTDLSDDGIAPRAWLRERIARDFAERHVVMVDGWMLSSVEARLCAIAYLSGVAAT